MEIITGEREDLFDMLSDALKQAKDVKTNTDKIALYNYIGNLYGSINVNDWSDFPVNYKDCFQNRRNYLKFLRMVKVYEDRFCQNFFDYKEFHSYNLGNILFGYEQIVQVLAEVEESQEIEYLGEKDFFEILFGFLSKYGLEKDFRDFMDKRRIFSKVKKHEKDDYLGLTIFNPLNRDCACLITGADYDLSTMYTLVHEFGHVYDLSLLEGDLSQEIANYSYLSCYPEVFPKLLEKLFLQYLIDEGIVVDIAKDKYIDSFIISHDFMLSSYLFTLIGDKYFRGGKGLIISNDAFFREVKKHFRDDSLVREFIYGGSTNMFNDTLYAYGDVMATHLLEAVKVEGLSSPDLKKFMAIRTHQFAPNFLIDNDYTPEHFIKVFKKEVELCKK